MDKDWLKYWQKVEDLDNNENEENNSLVDNDQKEQEDNIKGAKDLYQSVLDNND